MTTTHNGAQIEHEIGPAGELVVRVETGEIEVRGTDTDVARVRDLDGGDLEDRFIVERATGRLSVRPRDRLMIDLGLGRKGRSGSVRLAVEVPRTASVSLDTASGRVRAAGLGGEQRYRTVSGDVALVDVEGVLSVDAVSGNVAIEAAGAADLSGRLVSGDLRLTGPALRTVALGTASGDVWLDAPLIGPGPYGIQTVSGDVEVVAGRPGLRVEARTVTGQVTSGIELASQTRRDKRALVIGDGALTVSFKSVSGDLRVAGDVRASGGVASHASPEPPSPPASPPAPVESWTPDAEPDRRLAILVDLEAGAIDVDTATRRLAELEEESGA